MNRVKMKMIMSNTTAQMLRTDKGRALTWQQIHDNEKPQTTKCADCDKEIPSFAARRVAGVWVCPTCEADAWERIIDELKKEYETDDPTTVDTQDCRT